MKGQVDIGAAEFDFVANLLHSDAAIVLEAGKEYLVEGRLAPLLRETGLGSISELVNRLRADPSSPLRTRVVDALTTNETLFFRDGHPFDSLRSDVLPDLISRREDVRRLRIWSAACSSGQEAVSLGIVLRDGFPRLSTWDVKVLATDVSPTMVQRARRGVYTPAETRRGLTPALVNRYFEPVDGGHRVVDEVRRSLDVQLLNLVEPWPLVEQMDLILLRNVLIYFNQEHRRGVLDRMIRVLRPDGVLLLGGVETTLTHPGLEPRNNGRTTWFVKRADRTGGTR